MEEQQRLGRQDGVGAAFGRRPLDAPLVDDGMVNAPWFSLSGWYRCLWEKDRVRDLSVPNSKKSTF